MVTSSDWAIRLRRILLPSFKWGQDQHHHHDPHPHFLHHTHHGNHHLVRSPSLSSQIGSSGDKSVKLSGHAMPATFKSSQSGRWYCRHHLNHRLSSSSSSSPSSFHHTHPFQYLPHHHNRHFQRGDKVSDWMDFFLVLTDHRVQTRNQVKMIEMLMMMIKSTMIITTIKPWRWLSWQWFSAGQPLMVPGKHRLPQRLKVPQRSLDPSYIQVCYFSYDDNEYVRWWW